MTKKFNLAGEIWNGPTSNIWSNDQCPTLENLQPANVEKCKNACKEYEKCTAFNYQGSKSRCALRGCSFPVPDPTWEKGSSWEGYYMSGTKLKNEFGTSWNKNIKKFYP